MRRHLFVAAALSVWLAAAPSAQAAQACFTAAEFEAEQAIRLHTDLMVIGLTCQDQTAPGQPSLFARYREFTDRHQAAVRTWEKALIGHYRKQGKGNPTRKFDSFRTSLANETSRRAIALTNPVFCAYHVPLAEKIMALSAEELAMSLSGGAGARVASQPVCDRPVNGPQMASTPGVKGTGVQGTESDTAARTAVPAR